LQNNTNQSISINQYLLTLFIEHYPHEHEYISTDQPELNIRTEFIKRSFNHKIVKTVFSV